MAPRTAGTLIAGPDITPEELRLAVRNHSMPLEAMRYDVTPLGLHYVLTHFDIPMVDPAAYELVVGGHVKTPLRLTLDDIKARPATTVAVTLECAGNGRSLLSPRPMSQPWVTEAVGNSEWTGTPLRGILDEAGLADAATEVVFTGLDRGVQGEIEQWYERSLSLQDASRPEVMLAYAVNGAPLPPQHGFPVRLIVPGWYGMTHVKWLRSINVLDRPFDGYQQAKAYHRRTSDTDPGDPVTRILPRALMVPPGIPDFMTRIRLVETGLHLIEGRAWSGQAPITKVEVSDDGGRAWAVAALEDAGSPYAWRRWTFQWHARPGRHELRARATDATGDVQPADPRWNLEGVENNTAQRVEVVVGATRQEQRPLA